MKRLLAVSFILISTLFCSCKEERVVEDQSIDFQTNKKSLMSKGCEAPDAPCAKIVVEYPELDEAETDSALNKIQNKINELINKPVTSEENFLSFEDMAKHFLAEYQNFLREYPETKQLWEVNRTTKIIYNRNGILSIEYTDFSYMGGAHPNTLISYYNFRTTSGEIININDIIDSTKSAEFLDLAEFEFRKAVKIDKGKTLEEAGFWFENNKFCLPENFLITENGLRFLFNSYEVAPYSMGQIKFEIPYNKIKNLMPEISML